MRSRWLIVAACLLAIGLTFAFYRGGVPVWNGRTTVEVGLVPSSQYLFDESGSALVPVESSRSLVARISDPIFRTKVIGNAKFEPATAAFSTQLAGSSLRAVALEGDRDVAVEVSAGSRADVEAVLRSLASEISTAHDAITQRRLDALRDNMTDLQRRIDFLEKTAGELGPTMLSIPRDARDQAGPPAIVPNLTGAAEFWNKLRDRAQRTANLVRLSEKTVIHVEPGTYPVVMRSVRAGRTAILAGFAMLAAIVVLIILAAPLPRRSASRIVHHPESGS